MRQIVKALAFLAALLPSLAAAQQPTLPPNTVLGRLGVSAGPAQAIPFSTLGPSLITSNLAVTAPLSISGLNLSITGAAGKVLAGAGPSFTSTLALGTASSVTGSLSLANSANVGTVTLGAASTATSWTFKFPTTAGSNGQSLITDGAGNTSWAAGTGTVNSGTAGQLTYYATTAAAVSGNANLTVSAGALTVGVAGSQAGTVLLSGGTSGATTLAGPASGGGVMTFPAGADTVMSLAASQTATNKTFTSPVINGGTLNSPAINAADNTFVIVGSVDPTKRVFFEVDGLTTGTSRVVTVPDADLTLVGTTLAQTVTTKTFTGSTYNGLTVSTTTGTFTLTNGKTLAVSNSLTFTGTDGNSFAFPSGSDTVVTLTAAQTLSSKTLTAPTINGGTASALTTLGIRSTGTGAFDLTIANTENLTAGRTLTVTVNNAARTLSLSGNLTLGADLIIAGASPITLNTSGSTSVTLPTSGTLATTNTAQTFSASNVFSTVQQFTDAKFSSGKIYPTSDSTTALQVTKSDGTTRVVNFDTTNARVGINKTAGAFDLDVNGGVNVGATLSFVTLDATSLGTSTTTITGLTVNNSPSASNDYLLYYSAADGRIRKATVGSIAAGATAGVSSLNGLTGGLSVVGSSSVQVAASGASITVSQPPKIGFSNCSLLATAATSALTIALKDGAGNDPSATSPCVLNFRNTTGTSGIYSEVVVTAATSLVISSGSTMGVTSSTAFRIWVVGFNDAGTFRLGAINCAISGGWFGLDASALVSSTAEGGAGAADNAGIFYTGTAVTSKAFVPLGYLEWSSAGITAGTWAGAGAPSNMTLTQSYGPGVKLPGDIVQEHTGTTTGAIQSSSTSYVDTTAAPATFTPKSAANLIKVSASGALGAATTTNISVAFYRSIGGAGATQVSPAGTTANFYARPADSSSMLMFSGGQLDSPNTASSLAYYLYWKDNLGTQHDIGRRDADTTFILPTTITLQEIMR